MQMKQNGDRYFKENVLHQSQDSSSTVKIIHPLHKRQKKKDKNSKTSKTNTHHKKADSKQTKYNKNDSKLTSQWISMSTATFRSKSGITDNKPKLKLVRLKIYGSEIEPEASDEKWKRKTGAQISMPLREIEREGSDDRKPLHERKQSCTLHVPALFLLHHFKGSERREREQTKAKILQFQRIQKIKRKKEKEK